MADVDYGGKSSSSCSCLSSITPTTTRFRRRARQRQLMLVLVGSMVSTTSSPMQTNGLQGYGEIYVNGQRVTDRDEVLFHGARALSGCPKSVPWREMRALGMNTGVQRGPHQHKFPATQESSPDAIHRLDLGLGEPIPPLDGISSGTTSMLLLLLLWCRLFSACGHGQEGAAALQR